MKAEVNRMQWSVTRRLNEWRNDQWSETLESIDHEDQSLWRMTKRVIRIPTLSLPLVTLGAIALLDSEKAEALADNLDTKFQPVTDPSVPAVIEMVDVALRSYFMTPAREPKLTKPEEIQEAIRGFKVNKAAGPSGIQKRALKHLQQRAVSLLVLIFNYILLTHYFRTAWKDAQLISILKTGQGSSTAIILSAH